MTTPFVPGDWDRDETNLWDQVSSGHRDEFGGHLAHDADMMALFNTGWLDSDASHLDRRGARDEFFDRAIEYGYFDDVDEFDWEAWREYMGYETA